MKSFLNLGLFGITLTMLSLHASPAHAAGMFWEGALEPETSGEATPEVIEDEMIQSGAHVADAPGAVATFEEAKKGVVQVLTFRMPTNFKYEFSVLIENGKIVRTFIVSTAVAGQQPILGVHRLTPEKQGGHHFPWVISHTYGGSPMYWAVNIRGGFFIHSTPHYGNLGKPASMGCVRTSLPDAMEVFRAVTKNQSASYSMVFEKSTANSPEELYLQSLLANSGMSEKDLLNAMDVSRKEVEAVSTGDLMFAPKVPAEAHARPFTNVQSNEADFPKCDGEDCWDLFKRPKAILQLQEKAIPSQDISMFR